MELEQRVKLLEQEVEILKNQIQATLLDIQAQLLTNAYPSLRSEEETARSTPNRSFTSSHTVRVSTQSQAPDEDEAPAYDEPEVRKVSPTNGRVHTDNDSSPSAAPVRPTKSARVVRSQPLEPDDEEPAQPYEKPIVRKVSVANDREQADDDTIISARPVRSARIARSQPLEPDDEEPAQPYEKPIVRKVSVANDREQADDDTIISARPIKSARIARSQPLEPDVRDESDDADERPARQNGSANGQSAQAHPAPVSHRPSQTQQAFDTEHINMEAWIRNRVEQVGVNRTLELIQIYEQKGRITPEVKETLLQFLAAYGTADDQPDQPETADDKSNRLILKLIAGVQNAGAGIGRRRKPNG